MAKVSTGTLFMSVFMPNTSWHEGIMELGFVFYLCKFGLPLHAIAGLAYKLVNAHIPFLGVLVWL